MTPDPDLLVTTVHRGDCAFGPGFYRITLADGGTRYCQATEEVEHVHSLLGLGQVVRVEKDAYCLEGDRRGDANTPDVVDAEQWLGMERREAMALVGLTSDREYARVYRQVEAAVSRRNDRERQNGVHASIVIKKRGRRLTDVTAEDA